MSQSSTVIIALKFNGGVVIAADSQVTDPTAGVRWPVRKLRQINGHPIVVGLSGSMGSADRMWTALEEFRFRQNTFDSRDRVRNAVDGCLGPEFRRISEMPVIQHVHLWEVSVGGLAAYWAADVPHIVEIEPNGELYFHEHFHAIGSGAQTAYAIWRTLGGALLAELDEPKSLQVALRILRTCINIEAFGVSEPIAVSVIAGTLCRQVHDDELQATFQYVSEWEEQERNRFLNQAN